LQHLLEFQADFDEQYAKWLSENIVFLNNNSIRLLDEYGAKSGHLVLYSLVTDFEYQNEL